MWASKVQGMRQWKHGSPGLLAERLNSRHPQEGSSEVAVQSSVDEEVHPRVGQGQQVQEAVEVSRNIGVVVDSHADQNRRQTDEEDAKHCQEELHTLHGALSQPICLTYTEKSSSTIMFCLYINRKAHSTQLHKQCTATQTNNTQLHRQPVHGNTRHKLTSCR